MKDFNLLHNLKINSYNNLNLFIETVCNQKITSKQKNIYSIIKDLSIKLDKFAGTYREEIYSDTQILPLISNGQQAYVDYSIGVMSKLSALNTNTNFKGYFGFVGYDFLRSDKLISMIRIPTICHSIEKSILSIRLQQDYKKNKDRDMRFVSSPDKTFLNQALDKLRLNVKDVLNFMKKDISIDEQKEIMNRLERLIDDYIFAQEHSRNVTEFNMTWSLRVFRRLGYTNYFTEYSELLNHPGIINFVTETLSRIIKENKLFVETINEAVELGTNNDIPFSKKEPGYLPLFLYDSKLESRLPLKCTKKSGEFYISNNSGFEYNVGDACENNILEFLIKYKNHWSPNIFLPIFLYRSGIKSYIYGKSSNKYGFILGHVLERVFNEKHPVSICCTGNAKSIGLFHQAAKKRHGILPEKLNQLEPGLLYKMITKDNIYD